MSARNGSMIRCFYIKLSDNFGDEWLFQSGSSHKEKYTFGCIINKIDSLYSITIPDTTNTVCLISDKEIVALEYKMFTITDEPVIPKGSLELTLESKIFIPVHNDSNEDVKNNEYVREISEAGDLKFFTFVAIVLVPICCILYYNKIS
jgi:hypothetical protein